MHRTVKIWISLFFLACASHAYGQIAQKVVDISTRPGVFQRMVVLSPQNPKAAVILFAGGHGGLQIFPNGSFNWGGLDRPGHMEWHAPMMDKRFNRHGPTTPGSFT